jgi:NADPH:quinone reductase-like Zn-dependent oxidoreductase
MLGNGETECPDYRSTRTTSVSSQTSLQSAPPRYFQVGISSPCTYDKPAIPPGSLVLVTGANGYLGMHAVDCLLWQGYHVRGAVRNEQKANWTTDYFVSEMLDLQPERLA